VGAAIAQAGYQPNDSGLTEVGYSSLLFPMITPHNRLPRRRLLQMFAAAGAAGAAGGFSAGSFAALAPGSAPASVGYGTDPDLMALHPRGEFWPLILTESQRAATTALCDVILPADELGPAASKVGVPEFIDEWISAPYEAQQADRPLLLEGIAWLDTESAKRFGKPFAELDTAGQSAIADDICDSKTAKPEFRQAARFFDKFRNIAAGGYYCTQDGWKAIGFVGNIATATFDGPPIEVLKLLDLEQTVV
jgi:Gluconate 2-dehydrogenase subunit 3